MTYIFMKRIWEVAPRTEDDIVGQILVNRGVVREEWETFLNPDYDLGTHAPGEFLNMAAAVDLVFEQLERGELIVIHGDYDADGVSGTALLHSAIKEICERLGFEFKVTAFLPDRERDGYGVAFHNVEKFGAQGVKLLITVDCGIANGLELARADELGIKVIVCDHHQLGQYYPEKAVVLHPGSPNETYPNKKLCGTGVAFKLATALFLEAQRRGATFPLGHEKWYLDLVAIATVTDVMPILGENRVLEAFGLRVLKKTRRPGLAAIMELAQVDKEKIDTTDIGFRIGPRLNAAGRLASAEFAFKALTATMEEASEHTLKLEHLNRERQAVFKVAYDEAFQLAQKESSAKVIVVYAPHWAPGIVGLIAGRLVNDFGVPAFAFTATGDKIVGSGRSVGGLHLVEAMNAQPEEIYFKRGGHPQACGLTLVSETMVPVFRAGMNEFAQSFFGEAGVLWPLLIDLELPLALVDFTLLANLERCAPFGEGNRLPQFMASALKIIEAGVMGSTGAHLKLKVADQNGVNYRLVGFGLGNRLNECKINGLIDVVYEVGRNDWNGRSEVQFRIIDWRNSAS